MVIVPAFFSEMYATFLLSKSRDAKLLGDVLKSFRGRLAIGSRAEDGPAGVMNTMKARPDLSRGMKD
jgi:lysophospholipid acyltransferase (LPLAT)-like uncharacterized protein